MVTSAKKALRPPPPSTFAQTDPIFNQWLHDLSRLMNGDAAPTAKLGIDGDWYADTTAHHIYVRVAGAWVLIV